MNSEPVSRVVSSTKDSVGESAWLKWWSMGPPGVARVIVYHCPALNVYSGGREKR